MDVQATLTSIGLSNGEARVYVSLLRLGRSRAGRIIKITGMQSSVIHNALNTLAEKGFITHVTVGSVKEYKAIDPSVIEQYLDAKKADYRLILPNLKTLQSVESFDNAEVFEGYPGILNAMLSMVATARKGEVFKYFAASAELLSDDALRFFAKADLIRKERGIVLRGIATAENKRLVDYTSSTICFTTQRIPPAMNIFADRLLIMSFRSKPIGILILSEEIARQYHALWDSVWKDARVKQ